MGMFEKMFSNNNPSSRDSREKSLLKKIANPAETAIKLAVFLTVLGGPMQASAESEKNSPEKSTNKIEDARLALGKIIPFVEKNDKSLVHTFGNTNVKSFKSDDGREIISATDKSFVILSIGDGTYSYLDKEGDGRVDRIVINKEESVEDRSSAKNGLYMFSSMDQLSEEVSITAGLSSEKIQALSFDLDKEEVSFIDAEDGTSGTVDGEKAKKAIEQFQNNYTERLCKLAADKVE